MASISTPFQIILDNYFGHNDPTVQKSEAQNKLENVITSSDRLCNTLNDAVASATLREIQPNETYGSLATFTTGSGC